MFKKKWTLYNLLAILHSLFPSKYILLHSYVYFVFSFSDTTSVLPASLHTLFGGENAAEQRNEYQLRSSRGNRPKLSSDNIKTHFLTIQMPWIPRAVFDGPFQ